jgi:hypothetical protein
MFQLGILILEVPVVVLSLMSSRCRSRVLPPTRRVRSAFSIQFNYILYVRYTVSGLDRAWIVLHDAHPWWNLDGVGSGDDFK